MEDDDDELPKLTPEDLRALEARELHTAVKRIHEGKPITRRQQELIAKAAERGAPPSTIGKSEVEENENPENRAASPHDSGKWGRGRIAEFYTVAGEPLSLRTIDRCNAIGRLADVGVVPPWDDPRGMAEWYRIHYRSDITKPAKAGGKRTLPAWILAGIQRAAYKPAAAVPAEAVVATGGDVPAVPMGDGLATLRSIVARVYSRWVAVQNDQALAPAAERAYQEAFEKLQMAEDRARKSGDTEAAMRAVVEEKIDRVLSRMPSRLAADLAGLRPEVLRAAADPARWPAWCAEFFAAEGERLVRTKFNPVQAA